MQVSATAALFDALPNPYLVLDRRLHIVGANRAYLAATRRSLDDIVGRWAWDAYPTDPETLRLALDAFGRVIRTKAPDTMPLLRFDIPRPEAEGGGFEKRYWSITVTPVLDGDGEVELLLQNPIDVTELERLKEAAEDLRSEASLRARSGILERAQSVQAENLALKGESDRLRGLFEWAPSFMAITRGPDHRFELANRALIDFVGRGDLLGQPARQALAHLDGQGFFELMDQVRASGQRFIGRGVPVVVGRDSNGSEDVRHVDFVYQPMFNADGSNAGIFLEGTDITEATQATAQLRQLTATLEERVAQRTGELHAAEEQLRQSQKMEALGQLTGGIAHDFNNLLATITTSIELSALRVDSGQLDEVARFLGLARKAALTAGGLVHRLLAFARNQTLDLRAVDVAAMAQGMAEILQRTLGDACEVRFELAPDACPIRSDAHQLESALLNLCINARDAMPAGGRLTVAVQSAELDELAVRTRPGLTPGHYTVLRVTDTGTGMPASVASRVFEPFFSTKPTGRGTGLGLSMVYGFVRQTGGHVYVDSVVGEGSSFSLYMPCHAIPADAAEPVASPPGHHAAPARATRRVLFVDDEDDVRTALGEALRQLGYDAVPARSAEDALARLASFQTLDLLLTDVGLPGLDGHQLAERVRERFPGVPVLYITGYAGPSAARGSLLGEGMALMPKPFTLNALSRKVEAMLTLSRVPA